MTWCLDCFLWPLSRVLRKQRPKQTEWQLSEIVSFQGQNKGFVNYSSFKAHRKRLKMTFEDNINGLFGRFWSLRGKRPKQRSGLQRAQSERMPFKGHNDAIGNGALGKIGLFSKVLWTLQPSMHVKTRARKGRHEFQGRQRRRRASLVILLQLSLSLYQRKRRPLEAIL